MPETSLIEDCRHVREVRAQRDIAYKVFQALDEEYSKVHGELIERFEREDSKGVKTSDTAFVPTYTRYGVVQDRDEFVKWAQKHHPELLSLKEEKKLINEIVRECDDDGRALPPGLGLFKKRYVSQTAV